MDYLRVVITVLCFAGIIIVMMAPDVEGLGWTKWLAVSVFLVMIMIGNIDLIYRTGDGNK